MFKPVSGTKQGAVHVCSREAVKRLRIDQDIAEGGKLPKLPVHSSMAALLSWRYCQLLTVLPKR